MVDLSNLKILNELSKATNDISKGELIQLDLVGKKEVTLDELLQISYFKTGRLFEASAKCGAILVNENDKKYISNVSSFAKNLGIAFQIKDDMLDYSQSSKHIGKPTLQDLREGKITYPLYFAMKAADTNDKRFLQSFLGVQTKYNTSIVLEKIEALGGNHKTEELLLNYIQKSKKLANKIENKQVREEMLNLSKFSYERTK
jgi:octaprenyl-diphosphate synthase